MRIATILLIVLLVSPGAYAQEAGNVSADMLDHAAKLDLSGDGEVLTLSGVIGQGTGEAFAQVLEKATRLRFVRLDSPGGLVDEAKQVATTLQRAKLDTYVLRDCASTCTLIFYAGKNRWVRPEAQISFHGYRFLKGHRKAALDLVDAAQQVDQQYYRESGLPDWFIDKIFNTPNNTMWRPTTQELLTAKFATNVTVDERPIAVETHDTLPSINQAFMPNNAPLPQVIGP